MRTSPIFKKLPGWLLGLICLALVFPATALGAETTPTTTIPPKTGAAAAKTVTPTTPSRSPTAPGKAITSTTPSRSPTPTVMPTPTPGPKIVTKPPNVKAPSAIAVDSDTGQVLFSKNIHTQRAMASTTKIMTALTFLSIYPTPADLQAVTTVVQEDLVGEADMGLRKGEQIKLSTLLLGLLTNSANEAGMALARYAGQRLSGPPDPVDRFVAAMNTYALSLGMYDSHYMNPHGLDQPGHYSSAYDLAISGWYALRNPIFMQDAQYLSGTVDGHSFYNQNSFLSRYPGATGLKPGLTDDAGRCLVASARHNGHNVIVVVLNSPLPAEDADPLMDYAFTLLDGKADQPLSSINLGWLEIPPARPVTAPVIKLTPKTLQTAFQQELEYTLRLTASLILR